MYQVIAFLHLTAAAVWVGGLLVLALVVVPVARALPAPQRVRLVEAVGRRFLPVAWTALAVLVVTGIVALIYRGVTWEALLTGRLWTSAFGRILAVKVVLVAATLVLGAFHDFRLGPASSRLAAREGADSPAAARLRRQASWLARANAVLALVIVALAVMLVRGVP
jgi:putative copper resistance protein D